MHNGLIEYHQGHECGYTHHGVGEIEVETVMHLVIHEHGGDRHSSEGEDECPPRDEVFQSEESPEHKCQHEGKEECDRVEEMCKHIDRMIKLEVGNECHCRWRQHDKERRQEFLRQLMVENDTIQHDGQKDDPEKDPHAKEVNKYHLGGKPNTSYRYKDIAHDRDEPCRIGVGDLLIVVDPEGDRIECHIGVHRCTCIPEPSSHRRKIMAGNDRQHQHGDGDRREEIDPYGVFPLIEDSLGIGDEFGKVDQRHRGKNAQRDIHHRMADHMRKTDEFRCFLVGDRQPTDAHHDRKHHNRIKLESVEFDTFWLSVHKIDPFI